MRTLSGKVKNVEYFDTSRNGNSRYTASIGGVHCFTGVDSSMGCAIKNYDGKRVKVEARIIRGKLTIDSRVEVLPENVYLSAQLDKLEINKHTDYPLTMQVRSEYGHTNFLNITPEQARAIFNILGG